MDEAVICPHCGCATGKSAIDTRNEEVTEYANKAWTYALIGFFLAPFAIPGLIYVIPFFFLLQCPLSFTVESLFFF